MMMHDVHIQNLHYNMHIILDNGFLKHFHGSDWEYLLW